MDHFYMVMLTSIQTNIFQQNFKPKIENPSKIFANQSLQNLYYKTVKEIVQESPRN